MKSMLLCVNSLRVEALQFAAKTVVTYAKTDGKSIGTHIERLFCDHLRRRAYTFRWGSASLGLDLPELGVDVKATSAQQPQSSCAYRGVRQAIYGLGYDLLVFVYKAQSTGESGTLATIERVLYMDRTQACDHRLVRELQCVFEESVHWTMNDENRDQHLYRRISECLWQRYSLSDPSLVWEIIDRGHTALVVVAADDARVTMTPALQWRLSYSRATTQ